MYIYNICVCFTYSALHSIFSVKKGNWKLDFCIFGGGTQNGGNFFQRREGAA